MIRFNNNRKSQVVELIEDKDILINVLNISSDAENCLLFTKNNVKYKYAKCMQAGKMRKRSITMFLITSF